MRGTNGMIVGLHLVLTFLATRATAADAPEVLFADFEAADFGKWKVEGEAFGAGPAQGTLPNQMPVSGFAGRGLVNSFKGGDKPTGTLTSAEFTVERRYVSFLIGGGGWEGKTCMNLLIDGKPVRTAVGPNVEPGGSEELTPASWDVGDLAGKTARIEIVDRATGGWGHINVDQIVFTDRKPAAASRLLPDVSRELTAERRWLWFPIKSGAKARSVKVIVEGRAERSFGAELADGEPEWWSPLDVSAWRGKTLTVKVDRLPEGSAALTGLHQSDAWEGADQLYREPLRPQFHFSARRGWLNDPNGLVFYNGEYHLFFQHSPFTWGGGIKLWGQAVSKDLVHWEEIGEALWNDALGEMYSGSAVVDHKNTSGFGKDGKPPLVLIYTAAGSPFTQCIAYSSDGRTFTKYASNPVVKNVSGGNRDPKVFWHEPTKKWVMAFYAGLPAGERADAKGKRGERHTIQFYTSPNLREWTHTGVTEGGIGDDRFLFECPDLSELPIDGDAAKSKWVLSGADAQYALGGFDGTRFVPETPAIGPRSRGYYAAQTFSDEPTGRRIQIFWLQPPAPGMPFNQCMSVPLELSLRTTPEGPRFARRPVKELEQLRRGSRSIAPGPLKPGDNPLAGPCPELFDIEAAIEPGAAAAITFDLRGTKVTYDVTSQQLECAGHRQPAPLVTGALRLRVLGDRGVMELFASDGLVYVPTRFAPAPDNATLSLTAAGGEAKVVNLVVHELGRAWPEKVE